MPWRLLLSCVLVTTTSACSAVDRLVHGSARLRLDRDGTSSRPLLDVPVEAAYCAADTTLTIVGADRSWSVAVALRTAWPARSLEFALDSAVGGSGTAAVAIRPLRDSIGVAMLAVRGSLKLDAGPKVSGTMDFVAAGARDTLHLVGSLTAPSVTPGGCPTP
ncbi:MAG: hypothetical protein ACHQX4_02510 [Gemmatimonadales bacterium]